MKLSVVWDSLYYQPVTHNPDGIHIGNLHLGHDDSIDCGPSIGILRAADLSAGTLRYQAFTAGSCHPQLAALAFQITRRPSALNTYFLLTRIFDKSGIHDFYQLGGKIIQHPHFECHIMSEGRADFSREFPDAAYLVAGHIAELFYFRQDILEHLLNQPLRIWLYATQRAFAADGGAAGGNFSPQKGGIQLVLSRLYEGFNAPLPGVAPFLHEFGHLLDYFGGSKSVGFLPGLRAVDGVTYSPEAHQLFLKGKRLELERYLRLYNGTDRSGEILPIGHPYVFQNNSEFIAGYLEMFFRNPHYFAAQNPDLYQGFALLFRQDPRQYRAEDFPFYIQQNRDFYTNGQRLSKPGISV
jgi:hypothetical protein